MLRKLCHIATETLEVALSKIVNSPAFLCGNLYTLVYICNNMIVIA